MFKRIVLCSDGTWNTPDQKDDGKVRPSNVVKMALAAALEDDKGVKQIVFYDKGVGTGWFDQLLGGAFGWGLSKNIEDAYRFLIDYYEPGDEIYLFGFSRGAYTARSTAGLIRNCGILKKEYAHKFSEAYALYRRRDDESHPNENEAQLFRKTYAHPQEVLRIKFIGVWDTVGALGIPLSGFRFFNKRWEFHDVKLSSWVENAYQALAIDEKRKPFMPAIWEADKDDIVKKKQKLEQVWFAGVHTNIGGGYADTGLSDITFLWMKEKAEACGLAFKKDYLEQEDDKGHKIINPNPYGAIRDSRTGFYKLIRAYDRPIGRGKNSDQFASEESVHQSAIERMQHARDPVYKSENLVTYLKTLHSESPDIIIPMNDV